jgi:hypothetical protein
LDWKAIEMCFHGVSNNTTVLFQDCVYINSIRFAGEWGNFYLLSEERFLEGTWRQWAENTAGCGV